MLATESLYIMFDLKTKKKKKKKSVGKLISFTILLDNLAFVDVDQLAFKMRVLWNQNLTGCSK